MQTIRLLPWLLLVAGCEASSGGASDAGTAEADATSNDSATADDAARMGDGATPTVDSSGPWTMPTRSLCATSYAAPTDISVSESALREASGVVASPHNLGVVWSHNDSGDLPRLYALGTDGSALGRLSFPGVDQDDFEKDHDLEDLAAAPCPDLSGPCLWAADTGNNDHDRTDLALYVVAEPDIVLGQPMGSVEASRMWTIPFAYPPGVNVDSEALAVMPDASAFYLFEKIDAASARIFGASGPFADGVAITLTLAGTMASPGVAIAKGRMITGADMHPTGNRLLVRVYTGVYEYRFSPGSWPAHLDQAALVTVILGPFSELQGEAVGYDEDGTGLWTISEDRNQQPGQPLHHYACQ